MLLNSADLTDLDLLSAIDPAPLTVSPDDSVMDVITQMNERDPVNAENSKLAPPSDKSCALVVKDGAVVGIFTERDIVRHSAKSTNFEDQKISELMVSPVKTLAISELNDVFAVLFLFRRWQIRHLPILSQHNQLAGLISQTSLRSVLKPVNLLKLRRIAEVMTQNVISAPPDLNLLEIAKLMAEQRVSCIVIAEEQSDDRLNPLGIITERDLVQYQYQRLDLSQHLAKDKMSAPLIIVEPEDSLWNAYQLMKRNGIRRLVVAWNWGKNLGLVTQTSLLRLFDPMEMYAIIETLQQTVADLEEKNKALEAEKVAQASEVPSQAQGG